jgi:hypothetical protein
MPTEIHDAMEGNTNFGADTDPSIDPSLSRIVGAWLARAAGQEEPSNRETF